MAIQYEAKGEIGDAKELRGAKADRKSYAERGDAMGLYGFFAERGETLVVKSILRCLLYLGILLNAVLIDPTAAWGQYSPEHPKVVEMVDRGIKFLDNPGRPGGMVGGEILIGYAILLGQADPDHPLVRRGVETALEVIRKATNGSKDQHIVYEVSVAVCLLASHNQQLHRSQLEAARDWLVSIQRPNGGYGYLSGQNLQSGDTSQIQYVVLAFWALHKIGLAAPVPTIEGIARFLVATQDPSGAWGYQGVISRGSALVPQSQVTRSLGTAGIGALLMSADILKLFGGYRIDDDGLPTVFERVENRSDVRQEGRATLNLDDIDVTLELAFRFQDTSPPQGNTWYYYWRYAQERFESFRELVEGKRTLSPDWYNQAVEEFAESQDESGAWMEGGGMGTQIDTAFAVLFLIRSTQRSLARLNEGLAFGGYELPSDITSIRMVGERIVSDAESSVENLLELMESEEGRITEGMLPKEMQLSDDPETRSAQAGRLARLLRSSSPTARRLAARLLGRSEEINVAPDLIYALMDPDPHVPQIAEEGLRLLSRRLKSVFLKAEPTDEQRQEAVRYWKQWFIGLKPDYLFLDR